MSASPPKPKRTGGNGRAAGERASAGTELSELLRFLDASPTPYHAVATAEALLTDAGFRRLPERADWKVAPGDRCFTTRGGSSILAMRVGAKPPAEAGFRIVGAPPGFAFELVRDSTGAIEAVVLEQGPGSKLTLPREGR